MLLLITSLKMKMLHVTFLKSVHPDVSTLIPQNSNNVRSITFPVKSTSTDIDESSLYSGLSRFKYLRVLDLCGLSVEVLPSSIGRESS